MRQIAATKRDIGRGLDPVPRNGGRDVFRGGGNSGDDPSTCSDKYCDGQGGDGPTREELRCPGSASGRPANEGGDIEPRRSPKSLNGKCLRWEPLNGPMLRYPQYTRQAWHSAGPRTLHYGPVGALDRSVGRRHAVD